MTSMITNQNENRDQKTVHKLAATLDRQAKYEDLIATEKDKINELETAITQAEKRTRESRRRLPSARQLEAKRSTALTANKALENRIQQVQPPWLSGLYARLPLYYTQV
ncbi:hypothetical protein SK128_001393 [Halocaridina rubra]|uniref:Uncharacterized protein n=1 Tax=Halocaridina rubra TaxID=373956 RepID=A0AAN8WE75_HALRR